MAQGFLLNSRRVDKAFRATISVTAGQSYRCVVGNIYDGIADLTYTHNFGDGTVLTGQTPVFAHDYDIAGDYIVSITPEHNFPITHISGSFKTVINWGNASLRLDRYILQLTGIESVPNAPFPIHSAATELNMLFGSAKLKTLPSNFFSKCENITRTYGLFRDSTFETLPSGIFDSFINSKSIESMFYGATFQDLPTGIFDKMINLESAYQAFNLATFEALPERLFYHNVACCDFWGTFQATKGFELPNEMFNYNAIQELNADMTFCFGSARTSHTGAAYPLWEYTSNGNACYSQCFDLDNYNDIPDDWK